MSRFHHELARQAVRQHNLLTVAQAARIGGDRRLLNREVDAGRLVRLDRDIYRIAGVPLTWEANVLAAVLASGPGAVASFRTAACLWGIDGFGPGAPEISIPRGRRLRRAGVRVHESTDLDRCRTVVRDRIPTTGLGRTLLDIGRYVTSPRLRLAVEWSRRNRALTWNQLAATLVAHARRGRPGVRRLREVIAADAARDEVTDSDFELMVMALLAEHGLPEPVLHLRIFDGTRFVAEVDLAYPELHLAVELDGSVHRQVEPWERDHVKLVELDALGWTVLPFTWRSYVERPDWLVARVRAALDRRSLAA